MSIPHRLYYSTSSPFARKARIVVREKALEALVEEVECNPFDDPAQLRQVSPLSKVPALAAGDLHLSGSSVICEFLDMMSADALLIPASDRPRWEVLRTQALADEVTTLAVALTLEQRRPENSRSVAATTRWIMQINSGVSAMTELLHAVPTTISLGHIAMACALGYLDFRHRQITWRTENESLGAWFAEFDARPAMQATAPSDLSYSLTEAQRHAARPD